MHSKHKQLKYACYTSSLSMSVAGNLSPILFLTFRTLYGISYSLLGLLVLINFFTQLLIDLVFSFFSHKFNISKTVKIMPILTASGLLIYALWPFLFPHSIYMGLLIGTLLFSAAAGLGEVLISPLIAALPSDNPDREMSKLHSVYAWGVVFVVVISTLFLLTFGSQRWQGLAVLFALIPIISAILFSSAEIPCIQTSEKASAPINLIKNRGLWLYFFAIFLGGASELTMGQWASGYLEHAMNIPKVWGDIFGVALFSALLGLGRTLYSKLGKNISLVLLWGSIGATLCYLIAALSPWPIVGLAGCAFTGFCVSMLWPGSLVAATERFEQGGVFIYALMAAGGDLGASIGPQLIGIITDAAFKNPILLSFAEGIGISPDQFGMRIGMLVGMLFPLAAITLFGIIKKSRNEK